MKGCMSRIFFIHVGKTSGTSVASFLRSLYDPVEICPWPSDNIWDAAHAAQARHYKLIVGHFDIDYVSQIREPGLLLCVLRNPYERIRSLYDYWRSHTWQFIEANFPANPAKGPRFAKQAAFDEFISSGNAYIRQRVWNGATRQLLGNRYLELQKDQERAAREAFEVLKSMPWFGLSEFTEESLRRLAYVPPRSC
jgi:hypothetical protein